MTGRFTWRALKEDSTRRKIEKNQGTKFTPRLISLFIRTISFDRIEKYTAKQGAFVSARYLELRLARCLQGYQITKKTWNMSNILFTNTYCYQQVTQTHEGCR